MQQMRGRTAFERDRLPDPADRAIPALLAMRDFGKGKVGRGRGVAIGQDAGDLEQVVVGQHRGRHRHRKRQIAALVFAQNSAIDPHRGMVAHRAKMQDHLAGIRRAGETAAVAGPPRHLTQVGKLRLPGLGHGCHTQGAIRCMDEVPFTIKALTISRR